MTTPRFKGTARIRFFRQGIDQHLDCPEIEAEQQRQLLSKQGAYVYRVDFYDDGPPTDRRSVVSEVA